MSKSQIEEKLIVELQNDKYRLLYDTRHINYKNNIKKNAAWLEIANEIDIPALECQSRWKNLKRRYMAALAASKQPSGSGAKRLKPELTSLINEMQYFNQFLIEAEPTISNFEYPICILDETDDSVQISTPTTRKNKKNKNDDDLETLLNETLNGIRDRQRQIITGMSPVTTEPVPQTKITHFCNFLAILIEGKPECFHDEICRRLHEVVLDF